MEYLIELQYKGSASMCHNYVIVITCNKQQTVSAKEQIYSRKTIRLDFDFYSVSEIVKQHPTVEVECYILTTKNSVEFESLNNLLRKHIKEFDFYTNKEKRIIHIPTSILQ